MSANLLNRREFLGQAIVSGTGAALAIGTLGQAAEGKTKLGTPNAEKLGWRISCNMYTFRDRSLFEAIEVLSRMGVRLVEPGFFLPLSKESPKLKTSEELTPEQRREMKKRMEDLGMKMPTFYAALEGNQSVYRKIFDFAKEMEVETLVAEPPPEAFEALDAMCEEYKMKLAVHNHPEGSGSKYWNPDVLVKACQGRSERIGGCPDTGHWVRSGLNTLESLRKYKGRIITIHLKDAEVLGKRDSRDVPLGTGKGNYGAIMQQMFDWKWRGVMTIEYEHLSPRLVEDVRECVNYVEEFAKSKQA